MYPMQSFWVPQSICAEIDRITKIYILWVKSYNMIKGMHLIGWNTMSLPRHMVGLGLRQEMHVNTFLLGKLDWHMIFMVKENCGYTLFHTNIILHTNI